MKSTYLIRWGHNRTRKAAHTHRRLRREEALARQAKYDALTTEQKIARAKSRPGNSKRELAQLEN